VDADEREIYYYVKTRARVFTPARDISRRLGGKRRWRRSPAWAQPVLERMVERGILETDNAEGYRLKPIPNAAIAGKRWLSPELAELFKASGKEFSGVMTCEDADDYYDRL
jgi:hypothetical protein